MTQRTGVAPEDANMEATKGFVVPAGGGRHLDMAAPGRFAALKLLGRETNESIMLCAPWHQEPLRERFHWEVVGPNPL